jgi:nucleotide-binding universal stress UspA family protein
VQWRRIMSIVWKFGPKLALCGVVCGLCLVGWAGRFSIAQSRLQDAPAPVDKPEEPKAAVPDVKAELPKSKLELPKSESARPLPAPPVGDPGYDPSLSLVNPLAPAPVVVGPDHSPLEAADPEKVASDFLEQNQKMAEAHLKALKEEAEKLKARLTKVEAGIKRWDRLLEAFKQSGNATTAAEGAVEPAAKHQPAAAKQDLGLPHATKEEAQPAPAEPGPKLPDGSRPASAADDVIPT